MSHYFRLFKHFVHFEMTSDVNNNILREMKKIKLFQLNEKKNQRIQIIKSLVYSPKICRSQKYTILIEMCVP